MVYAPHVAAGARRVAEAWPRHVLTLGAGNVWKMAEEVLSVLGQIPAAGGKCDEVYQGLRPPTDATPGPPGRLRPDRAPVRRVGGAGGLSPSCRGSAWRRIAPLTDVRVEGLQYLDAARVAKGVGRGKGSTARARPGAVRQGLLLHPRIALAEVSAGGPRGVTVPIGERQPVLLVHHGVPWEMDSSGVLLAPLQAGAVADVPLLTGPVSRASRPVPRCAPSRSGATTPGSRPGRA